MSASPLKLFHFEGGDALPAFRAQSLLQRLQAVCARIDGVAARHLHWVAFDAAPAAADLDKLRALLSYGDPYRGADGGELFVVMPRLGTVSPWASKATDIARNCGLTVHRIERVVEFRLTLEKKLLGASRPLADAERHAVGALLHDRMTESLALDRKSVV